MKNDSLSTNFTIIGGAGFIGSHISEFLLNLKTTNRVTVIDNFSSGSWNHLSNIIDDPRLLIIEREVALTDNFLDLIEINEVIIHLASNPDIARAETDPTIDFFQGTLLTQVVAEAARVKKAKQIIYASGSGVYGDHGYSLMDEDSTPLKPISTYGASKLAGETIFRSYAHMFQIPCIAFRFGNVVGSRQTHGVGFDFLNKLMETPHLLTVLGDGTQSKTYVDVSDVINAIWLAHNKIKEGFDVFNVGTEDYVKVSEIAEIALDITGQKENSKIIYSESSRGWKGDVPIMRLSSEKIRKLGWRNQFSSYEAIKNSMKNMWDDLNKGKF